MLHTTLQSDIPYISVPKNPQPPLPGKDHQRGGRAYTPQRAFPGRGGCGFLGTEIVSQWVK